MPIDIVLDWLELDCHTNRRSRGGRRDCSCLPNLLSSSPLYASTYSVEHTTSWYRFVCSRRSNSKCRTPLATLFSSCFTHFVSRGLSFEKCLQWVPFEWLGGIWFLFIIPRISCIVSDYLNTSVVGVEWMTRVDNISEVLISGMKARKYVYALMTKFPDTPHVSLIRSLLLFLSGRKIRNSADKAHFGLPFSTNSLSKYNKLSCVVQLVIGCIAIRSEVRYAVPFNQQMFMYDLM